MFLSGAVLDVLSQFVMLYMLLSLSLGWTLSGTVKPARSFKRLRAKPAAKVIAVVGVLQVSENPQSYSVLTLEVR